MKLEVGMYVRYDYYTGIKIGKITKTWNDDEQHGKLLCVLDNKDVVDEFDIIGKPSHNIVDLIEVGDYVNGCKVLGFNIERYPYYFDDNGEYNTIESIKDIETIFTHEQFEREAYKV